MKMIQKLSVILILAMGLLLACAQRNPHPMDMTSALASAKTKADHEALAAHYEQAAKAAQAEVVEHKKLLDEYKAKSYLYGKQTSMLEDHCQALVNSYQQVADANLQMAKLHRAMENP